MKRKLLTTLIILVSTAASAQEINFSQFYELPLLRNPALAGHYRGDIRVTSAFRSQWNSETVPFKTTALGTELKLGLGQNSYDYHSLRLQLTYNVAGDSRLGRTQIMSMIASH